MLECHAESWQQLSNLENFIMLLACITAIASVCWLIEVQILNVLAEFVPITNAAATSPSAAERFSSPAAGTGAKRRLFDSGEGSSSSNSSSRGSTSNGSSQAMPIPMVLVADKMGRQVCNVHSLSFSLSLRFSAVFQLNLG